MKNVSGIKDDLGFDVAINYNIPIGKPRLAAALPKAWTSFRKRGGEIRGRPRPHESPRPSRPLRPDLRLHKHDPGLASFGQLIIKRLRVEGFLIMDYIPASWTPPRNRHVENGRPASKAAKPLSKGLEKPRSHHMSSARDNIGKLIVGTLAARHSQHLPNSRTPHTRYTDCQGIGWISSDGFREDSVPEENILEARIELSAMCCND